MAYLKFILLALCAVSAMATIHFQDDIDENWSDRWVQSKHSSDYGKFVRSNGKFHGDAEKDYGLKSSQDAKFYALSTKFPKSFSNKEKTLVIQYSVKHEQNIDCGGGYVKVFPSTLDQADMHGESKYNLMFGPDICGPGTRKVHVIFNYNGKNLDNKKTITCRHDELSHLYTLIVNPDNTYEVRIDNVKVEEGSLYDDYNFLLPKKIPDPSQSKPADWVDEATIADPDDTKPADWDKPEHIADPEASKPEDWDDEMDGEWESPMIDNPEYKGEWKPRQIPNPAYKGEWVHPEIDNPEFKDDPLVYSYDDFGALGLDLWQVKSGSIFDNFLITDSVAEAEEAAADFLKRAEGEKAMKEKEDNKAKEESEKAAAAAAAADEKNDEEEEEEEEAEPVKDEL